MRYFVFVEEVMNLLNPKIYLAMDNCFASKRWTRPNEWMDVIKKLGIYYIEASADNECDPLYTCKDYLNEWMEEVKKCSAQKGVKIVNFYSGHGSYTTLGLSHTDLRVRDRFLNDWLKPMAKMAGSLGCGLGFYCHAFNDSVLQNVEEYKRAEEDLYERLSELSVYSWENDVATIGIEQMYTPHQIPWTIKGTEKLLKEVYKKSKKPFYITIDTGHQTGQRKFMKPGYGQIKEVLRKLKQGEKVENLWLGPKKAYEMLFDALSRPELHENKLIENIGYQMKKYPYLFSEYEDGDPYIWLEKFACYSPIIHLQQTSGESSAHLPFTKSLNRDGIIFAEKILKAINVSYQNNIDVTMPPRCDKIYLTLEIFSGTADINYHIIDRLRESVEYWRRYIPEDGTDLQQLIRNICDYERKDEIYGYYNTT